VLLLLVNGLVIPGLYPCEDSESAGVGSAAFARVESILNNRA